MRAATSGPTSTTVNISWSTPYAAANNTVVDARAMTYHVYRYDLLGGTYTEIGGGYLSSGPLTTQDTAASASGSYRYVVQAVDPSNSSYWGQASATGSAGNSADVAALISQYGSIQGVVTGNGGAPVAGASVNVVGGVGVNTIVQTDVNGAYSVAGLLPGTFSVGVTSATGYNTQTVPSVSVTAGSITTQDFALTPITYAITPSFVPGGGGVISPGTATQVPYGTDQTFDIIPNPGYQVSSLIVDGVAQTAPLPTSYTFTNVKAVHTISATFAITTFNVTWSISGVSYGTVSPASPQTVGYGSRSRRSRSPRTRAIRSPTGPSTAVGGQHLQRG